MPPLFRFYYSVHFRTVMMCIILTVHFCTVNTIYQKTFHFCTVYDIIYTDACFVPRVFAHATTLITRIRSSKNGREIHQPGRLFDS